MNRPRISIAPYAANIEHRTNQPQNASVHPAEAELFYVVDGSGTMVTGGFDFFNIFNANFVTGRSTRAGPTYLIPSGIILLRILQTGVTYVF